MGETIIKDIVYRKGATIIEGIIEKIVYRKESDDSRRHPIPQGERRLSLGEETLSRISLTAMGGTIIKDILNGTRRATIIDDIV